MSQNLFYILSRHLSTFYCCSWLSFQQSSTVLFSYIIANSGWLVYYNIDLWFNFFDCCQMTIRGKIQVSTWNEKAARRLSARAPHTHAWRAEHCILTHRPRGYRWSTSSALLLNHISDEFWFFRILEGLNSISGDNPKIWFRNWWCVLSFFQKGG